MNLPKNHEILVVGGGVIGIACAYYLARAGRQVCLIDQDRIGAGASHGNCGLVFSSHLVPLCVPGVVRKEMKRVLGHRSPLYIKPTLDITRLLWFIRFASKCTHQHVAYCLSARDSILRSSVHLYNQLFELEALEADYEKKGVLMVYKTEQEMSRYEATNRLLEPFGLQAQPVIGDDLRNLEPALRNDVYGAWYHRDDSHLRPDKLLDSWKQLVLQSGVSVVENCRLAGFHVNHGRIESAQTSRGEFTAEHYVLAAGAWSAQIGKELKLSLPVQPGKGYSITMARPEICPQIPCYLHERSVVATPWGSGYRLGGTMEFSGLNEKIVSIRLQNLKTAAREYLLDPIGNPVLEEWAGLRPMTYDDLPLIGRGSRLGNLFLATGHGMLGIAMAPGTGKLVAELITGAQPHIDPSPFAIQRFS